MTAPTDAARPVHSTLVCMQLSEDLAFERWKSVGASIGAYASASSWWLGDWLTFGRRRYGEQYREGIAATGLGYQTLRNYAVVARRFAPSRRRDDLSFQHHAEVCSLRDDDQDFWLDFAAERGWSRAELRRRLRAARTRGANGRAALVLRLELDVEREHLWDQAARYSGRDLESWARTVLDEAASSTPGVAPLNAVPGVAADIRLEAADAALARAEPALVPISG
jgi:hypothetical protein